MSGRPPLRLELRASPVATLLTAAMHAGGAAVLIAWLPLFPGLCAATLLVALGTILVWERTLLSSNRAPATLCLGRDGVLGICLRNGSEYAVIPAIRCYVSRWFVVLALPGPRDLPRTILVARDMLAPEGFRRVRLWALWRTLPDAHFAVGA